MNKIDVVQHFGSEMKLADILEVSRQAINKWPDPIPEGVAYKLQVLTGGALRVDPAVYKKPPKKAKK